ncbi:MAG: hypothetical protein PHE50_01295 [Dehalococcoidales bacterium]|nr:hypothetical protein [Dehalococcoidales bacterium]
MKLALILLFVGAITIGTGFGLRQSGIRQQSQQYLLAIDSSDYLPNAVAQESAGIGLLGFGGVFVVGSVVLLIVKRQTKSK